MTLVITHATVTGAAADATALVDGPKWDANHTLTGVISPAQGGTGIVNNNSSTITITGSFGITFTVTAATTLTFPTTGTLATTSNTLGDFASTTSAQLAGVISDETGTGALVFANTPTLVTPVLGVATATTVNKVTITAPASAATLTLIDGTTLTGPASSGTAMTLGNTETVTGVKTFGSAGAVGRLKVAGTTSGTITLDATATAGSNTLTLPAETATLVTAATTKTLTNTTYDTAGAGNSFSINGVAATANTGTGSVVRATSPTLVTPALGTPTALVLTSATGLPLATGVTGNLPTANAPIVSAFSVHKNAVDQTGVVSATFTQVTWGTELYDIGSNFASNAWTPPAGKVHLSAGIQFSGTISAGANCQVALFKNGAAHLQVACNPFTNAGGTTVAIDDVANGSDVYTISVYITTSAGTATVLGLAAQSRFSGHWIST